jgi:hypothetical protein
MAQDIGAIDFADFTRQAGKPDRAEIKVGSLPAFTAWIERQIPLVRDDSYLGRGASFVGVPVVHSRLVPGNMAVLLVNDEVQAVVRLDSAGCRTMDADNHL